MAGWTHVNGAELNSFAQPGRPFVWILERVGLVQPTRAIVVHDHVHLSGPDEGGVQVYTEDALAEVLVSASI